MSNPWASATLKHPDGTQVHLIGVSHISAFSGHHVYHAIRNIRPDAVVLEVDERRYKEASVRAQRWLVDDDKRALVAHATQSYLQPGGIWRQLLWEDKRSAYNLSNEGGALVEGSIYGSEVILACEAASQCNAEIVLADRSKPVSNARLSKALQEERHKSLQGQADDDVSLLMRAAALTIQQLQDHVSSALRSITSTSSEFYGERLHPIFLLVAKPHYKLALKGAGCSDPDAVVAALERLMTHGSTASGAIHTNDLKLVQESIARIERQKAKIRKRAFATTTTHAPPQPATATSEPASAADACSSVSSATAPTPDTHAPPRCDGTPDASCSGAAGWTGSAFVHAIRWFFLETDPHPSADRTDAFYQWCWRGVGNMHSFKLHEHVADFDATHLYTGPGPSDMSPYYRTVVHERDTILATRLWHEAAAPGKKTIVAVVGANHLPGIVQNWPQAGSDAMRSLCSEFLSLPSRSVADGSGGAAAHSWQDVVVHGTVAVMQGAAAGALAYAPMKLLFNRARGVQGAAWPLRVAAVPAVVLGGLTVGASLCDSWRMSRVAQLVDNLAAVSNAAQ